MHEEGVKAQVLCGQLVRDFAIIYDGQPDDRRRISNSVREIITGLATMRGVVDNAG